MLGNWIKQSTTDTGTGNLALSAVTGHPTFAAEFAGATRFAYTITDADGLPIERGVGYLSGGVLVRERVRATYASGVYTGANPSAVSLAAGTKYVICSPGDITVMGSLPGVWSNALGKYYGDGATMASGGTLALTANRVYAIPFVAEVDSDIDAIAFRVTTAGAASTAARVAYAPMGSDGLPLMAERVESATVAVDSTGNKICTITRVSPAPRYFVLLLSDGAPAVSSSAAGMLAGRTMGVGASLDLCSYVHHVGATGLAFPATFTPVVNASNASRPMIFVRCA